MTLHEPPDGLLAQHVPSTSRVSSSIVIINVIVNFIFNFIVIIVIIIIILS